MNSNNNIPPATDLRPLPGDSVLNVAVSCFESYRSTTSIMIVLFRFITSPKYVDKVFAIRQVTDKKLRDEMKSQLPACTPSGIFKERNTAGLIRHSGLMQVDIDFKDNTHINNYDELKKQLCNIPNVAFCSRSVSGTGYFLLVPIKWPNRHKEHFNVLVNAFRTLGINIDESCKDVVRLRGYTYDDDPYINHYASPFCLTEDDAQVSHARVQVATVPSKNDDKEKNLAIIERATAFIEEHDVLLVQDYNSWFQLGCSIAATLGEAGREYFHRISKVDRRAYRIQEADNQYTNCLKNPSKFSLGTFIKFCRDVQVPTR